MADHGEGDELKNKSAGNYIWQKYQYATLI